jgi:hypothetical protein
LAAVSAPKPIGQLVRKWRGNFSSSAVATFAEEALARDIGGRRSTDAGAEA